MYNVPVCTDAVHNSAATATLSDGVQVCVGYAFKNKTNATVSGLGNACSFRGG